MVIIKKGEQDTNKMGTDTMAQVQQDLDKDTNKMEMDIMDLVQPDLDKEHFTIIFVTESKRGGIEFNYLLKEGTLDCKSFYHQKFFNHVFQFIGSNTQYFY